MDVLVTGAAGFIGYHVAQKLLQRGDTVLGLDNLSAYYDVALKSARLAQLQHRRFRFVRLDLADRNGVQQLFRSETFQRVCHLAAQPGVRYSLANPAAYVDSNLVGFANVLEGCRHKGVQHLVFASSSSVYGLNATTPFSTRHPADHPASLYAATKKANELMAHAYSHLYGIPATGLRFFTVYGPWGRPDMSPILFSKAIVEGKPIELFNHGKMLRDFTYVDDIVEGVVRALDRIAGPRASWDAAHPDPGASSAPYRLYNIGNHAPVELERFIGLLERELGRKAIRQDLPMQPGDIPVTHADVDDLAAEVGFAPSTPLEKGIAEFVRWFRAYYKV